MLFYWCQHLLLLHLHTDSKSVFWWFLLRADSKTYIKKQKSQRLQHALQNVWKWVFELWERGFWSMQCTMKQKHLPQIFDVDMHIFPQDMKQDSHLFMFYMWQCVRGTVPLQGLFLRVRSSGVSITSMYHIRDEGSSFLSSFNGSRLLFNKVSMKKISGEFSEWNNWLFLHVPLWCS